jgi:CheY-like chemotaxis protein
MSELRQRAQLERSLLEVPRVRASESRLAQVFLNLLNNAGEAIPRGAPATHVVSLRTFTDAAGWPVVEIADTGCGIPPEHLSEVFRPFFTTKGSTGGSGLGLAICERLVHEIGGRMEVESELGRGSKFRVVLPPADRVALPVEREVSTAPVHPRPLRVLVIDDDPAICRAFSRLLGKEEQTTTLESSREAVERIESGERFDVIFCDVMMPNLPGSEFFAVLGERWPDQAARVVFITGGVLGPGGRRFLEAHPGRLIEKPFTLAQIRAAIEARLVEVGLESSADEPGSSQELHEFGPATESQP